MCVLRCHCSLLPEWYDIPLQMWGAVPLALSYVLHFWQMWRHVRQYLWMHQCHSSRWALLPDPARWEPRAASELLSFPSYIQHVHFLFSLFLSHAELFICPSPAPPNGTKYRFCTKCLWYLSVDTTNILAADTLLFLPLYLACHASLTFWRVICDVIWSQIPQLFQQHSIPHS